MTKRIMFDKYVDLSRGVLHVFGERSILRTF